MKSVLHNSAIIYCRVSSTDQLEGTSLDSQERLCREYAGRQGIEVRKVFIERGESAKTANRTELNRALIFCRKHKIGYFVVYKLDRFARNQDDHVSIRAVLRRSGTELRSVTEPIDETPIGRAMEGILSVFAELDNNIRTERTKQGMLERVRQGVWVWPAPVGYYRPSKGANIAPDPETARFVQLAFREYATGAYTYRRLADWLADRGFRTSLGRHPLGQWIEKILKNPIYCGVIDAWGEQHAGSFEPLVSQTLFDAAQAVRQKDSPHATPRSTNNPLFPLRAFVACEECGRPITGSITTNKIGRKYPYYHHYRPGCTKARFIPKATFEQLFIEYLDGIAPDPLFEKVFREMVLRYWKENYQGIDRRNGKLRKEIETLERERQQIFDSHRRGIYLDGDFQEQLRLVNQRLTRKHLLLEERAGEAIDMDEALSSCFNFIRDTAQTWKELEDNFPARLQLQRRIFEEKLKFDGRRFGTPRLSLIYQLKQEFSGGESHLAARVVDQWDGVLAALTEWQRFATACEPFLSRDA